MKDNNDSRSGRRLTISNITTKLEALKGKSDPNSQVDAIIQRVLDFEEKHRNSAIDLSDSDIEMVEMMIQSAELSLQREESLQVIFRFKQGEVSVPEYESATRKISDLYDQNLELIKKAIIKRFKSYGVNSDKPEDFFSIKSTSGYFHNTKEYGSKIDSDEKAYRAFEYSTEVTINPELDLDIKQQMIRALNEVSEWFQQDAVLIKGASKQTELNSEYYPGTPKVLTSGEHIAHLIDTVEFDYDLLNDILNLEEMEKAGININLLRQGLSSTEMYRKIVRVLADNGFYGGTFSGTTLNLAFIPKFDDRPFNEWYPKMKDARNEIAQEIILQLPSILGSSQTDYVIYKKDSPEKPYRFDILVGYNGVDNWAEGYFTPYEQLKGDSNEATDLRKQIVVELEN